MTELERFLGEIDEIFEGSSIRPWTYTYDRSIPWTPDNKAVITDECGYLVASEVWMPDNAKAIIYSRNHLPQMTAAVRRLLEESANWEFSTASRIREIFEEELKIFQDV